jgi:glycosyltransferase involved in cell wall biosynthesis
MKPSVILIKPTESPFIRVDEAALSKAYHVKTIQLNQDKGKLSYLMGVFKMFWSVLFSPKKNEILVWFADYHALPAVLAAKLTGKSSLVFIGGYDAVCYPAYRYGVYCNVLRKLCASIALKLTDLIVANDEALLDSDNFYYNPNGHPEGVYRLIPKLKTPARIIRNAPIIDNPPVIPENRIAQILCVGGTPRYEDMYNKGYDLLFTLAGRQTEWRFVLVGIQDNWLERADQEFGISELSNLVILPPLAHDEVIDLMLNSDIYVQPSISEGMPNALMEAMLCGCKPVGSRVAGIPKLIGNWGIVFDERNIESLTDAIRKAIKLDLPRKKISESITNRFSIELRGSSLIEAVNYLSGV